MRLVKTFSRLQARPVLVELGLGRGYFFFRRRQIGRHRLVFALSGFQALLDFIELIADVVDDHLGLGLLLTLLGHAGLDVVQLALAGHRRQRSGDTAITGLPSRRG